MAKDRHSGAAPFLEPDAKSQVTLRFEDGKPAKATAIVVSTQHKPGYDKGEKQAELHAYVKDVVARVHARSSCSATRPSITSTRPAASRLAVLTATPASPAARSSSTPTAARPRTAAARSRARTRPRSTARPPMSRAISPRTSSPPGLAQRCTIQLAYAIGVSEPLSLYVDTHGTGTVGDDAIEAAIGRIDKLGGLTPRGIRTHLGLNKPIYEPTAAYGHFGRKAEGDFFPWERVDLVEDLKAAVAAVGSAHEAVGKGCDAHCCGADRGRGASR